MICIDPGLRGCGVAYFNAASKQLVRAEYVKNPITEGRGPKAHCSMARAIADQTFLSHDIVLEFPRIYPGVRGEDMNDLLDLAGVDGAIAALLCSATHTIRHLFPSDWKGQVPKAKMNARVLKQLSLLERDNIVTAGSKDHNTLDAVGIGLYVLGRLDKRKDP